MWAQNILLAVIGLSAGVIVASGLFSFVIELGVVSDFADRTAGSVRSVDKEARPQRPHLCVGTA